MKNRLKNILLAGTLAFSLANCKIPDFEFNNYVPDFTAPENSASFIVYGQSNSVSPSQNSDGTWADALSSEHIWINDYYGEYSFSVMRGMEMVKANASHPLKSGAAWIYLSDSLYNSSGLDSVFYSCGVGGRSSTVLASEPYMELLLNVIKKHPEAKYVLYVQGESDNMEGLSEETTYNNLKTMINLSENANSSLKWIVSINGLGNPSTRNAQQRIINDGYALQGPDIDSIRLPDYSDVDLYGEGLIKHSEIWSDILKEL